MESKNIICVLSSLAPPDQLSSTEYRFVAKKGEGTFSKVLKAQCVKNGKMMAIQRMKNTFESEEQVTNLREIQALRRLSPHPGIVELIEVLYEQVRQESQDREPKELKLSPIDLQPL